jgi:CubicO group peptidase (beta-lactamase class C family)
MLLLASLALLLSRVEGQDLNSFDEFILSEMAAQNIPGLSMAVIRGDEISAKSFGLRKAGTDQQTNNETLFEAASLSKPVFALLVLKLAQEELIDLDQAIYEYIVPSSQYGPDFFLDESYKKITPRMVLTHTAGLPNSPPNPGAIYSEPGTRFAYSGVGFRYLAAAVEEITQQSLSQLFMSYVFAPLQMTNSSFVWRDEFEGNSTWGHTEAGVTDREILHLKDEFTEGGLVTNINDYGKFVQHILSEYQDGNNLIRTMVAPAILAVDYGDSGSFSWGQGWGVEEAELGRRIWHTGSNGVFKSFVIMDLQRQSAVLFFANAENGLKLIPGLLERTIGATALSGLYQQTISDSMLYRKVSVEQ